MLIGEYESKLTDKNRLSIPVKLRVELNDKLILCKGYEGCLLLLDSKRWEKLIELVTKRPLLQLNVRDTLRFLLGSAREIELDNQGRFVLPYVLKDYAKIENQAVFVGLKDWIEVWSDEKWSNKSKYVANSAGDIANKLVESYGIKT